MVLVRDRHGSWLCVPHGTDTTPQPSATQVALREVLAPRFPPCSSVLFARRTLPECSRFSHGDALVADPTFRYPDPAL